MVDPTSFPVKNAAPAHSQRPSYMSFDVLFSRLEAAGAPVHDEKYLEGISSAYHVMEATQGHRIRKDGSAEAQHPIEVLLMIVEEFGLTHDLETHMAALLHDTGEDSPVYGSPKKSDGSFRDVLLSRASRFFGAVVGGLVTSLTKPTPFEAAGITDDQKEILAMQFVEDGGVRSGVIKLADRLHFFRTLESIPFSRQQGKIKETQQFLIPMIERLEKSFCETDQAEISESMLDALKKGKQMLLERMEEVEAFHSLLPPSARLTLTHRITEPGSTITQLQGHLLDNEMRHSLEGRGVAGSDPRSIPLSSFYVRPSSNPTGIFQIDPKTVAFMSDYQLYEFGSLRFFVRRTRDEIEPTLRDIATPAFHDFSLLKTIDGAVLLGRTGSVSSPLLRDEQTGTWAAHGEYSSIQYNRQFDFLIAYRGSIGFILDPISLERLTEQPFQELSVEQGHAYISHGSQRRLLVTNRKFN